MKKSIKILCCWATVLLFPLVPLQAQPIGNWIFESGHISGNTVSDSAGTHDGTINGSWSLNADPEALILNGTTNYVALNETAIPAQLPTRDITLEAWAWVDTPVSWAGIINYIQDNSTIEHGFILGQYGGNFMFGLRSVSGSALTYMGGPAIETNKWYHLVGTYDGSIMKLYVNGALTASSTAQSGDISYLNSWYRIASYKDNDEQYLWDGMINEVALYDYALSMEEVHSRFNAKKELFSIEATTNCNGRVVGYFPDYGKYRLPIASVRYDKLTHINYFSISPNSDGSLDTTNINISSLQTLASTAHANGVTVSICVGGGGLSGDFSAMAANATSRANFISNLTQFCLDNNLDGADLDWEPVSTSTDRNNYTTLIQELKASLASHGLILTVALAGWGSEINTAAIGSIDWVNIMAYDMGMPHSSFDGAISTLNHWENFGFDRKKLNLGVPFYGKDSNNPINWYIYKQIIDTYHPGPEADWIDLAGTTDDISFSGINSIESKTSYVLNCGYGGIMIWEISQDSTDSTSLLTAIGDTIHELSPPDYDCDKDIDLADLLYFTACWLSTGCDTDDNWCGRCDLNLSGSVNLVDYSHFCPHWP